MGISHFLPPVQWRFPFPHQPQWLLGSSGSALLAVICSPAICPSIFWALLGAVEETVWPTVLSELLSVPSLDSEASPLDGG